MKFNKSLLGLLSVFALSMCLLLVTGCSSNPEKNDEKSADAENPKSAKSKTKADEKDATNESGKSVVVSSALPAGPATPNPYLLTKPKLSTQVEASFRDAIAAMQKKNWNYAEGVLKQLAAANPGLSGVHLNLGIVYHATGDNAKATEAFNKAIAANPKNMDAYNQLAVLKRETGDFAGAEALYKKVLAVWPFYPEGHKNIAILYELYMGKPDQALPHYQAYQQLLPAPDKQVDSWIADLQRRLNSGKNPEKAEAK